MPHRSDQDRQSPAVDLRADIHGRMLDFISDQDRRYFERHRGVSVYWRRAIPHEMCRPDMFPDCVSMFDLPHEVTGAVWVEVRQVVVGFRLRVPYLVVEPGEAA